MRPVRPWSRPPRSSMASSTSAPPRVTRSASMRPRARLNGKYRAVGDDLGIGSSSPAVAAGMVFIGDLAGVVHAVDGLTGKVRWTFKTGAEIKSSPVVSGDRVLIGSYDGHLYALSA